MKRIHFFIFFLVGSISFFGSVQRSLGLTYPITTPAGEMSGGTYRSYFDNMFPGCTNSGEVIRGFDTIGMPDCLAPTAVGLTISGSVLGSTLYFDGTDWVTSINIFNSGGAVSIGGVTPQSAFEVWSAGISYLHFRGDDNVAIGSGALRTGIISGDSNVAIGPSTLGLLSNGYSNVAIGRNAMASANDSDYSIAIGDSALESMVVGSYEDIAIGNNALSSFTSGYYNTAIGGGSLTNLIRGEGNVGIGGYSANKFLTGTGNTAGGFKSLSRASTGSYNTVFGYHAAGSNIVVNVTQNNNSIFGAFAGSGITSGSNNQLFGYNAGANLTTGSNNIGIGYNVQLPSATTSNQLNIGNSIFGSNIGLTTNQIFLGTGSLTTSNSSVVVKVNGNIQIAGSGAGSGKILVAKDASGLAEWGDVFASNVTSSGVIGGTGSYGYLIKFGSGGIGLELSTLFETGGFLGIGTTNPQSFIEIAQSGALYMHFRGTNTVSLGKYALNTLSSGVNNTAIGYASLSGNTTGSYNIAIGSEALNKTVNSVNNIAIGSQALYNTLSGTENIAIGRNTLFSNTIGSYNTALGSYALSGNTSGNYNIGFGYQALSANNIGTSNIALGYQSLQLSNGSFNIGIGKNTLTNNVGSNNIAFGDSALYSNTTGQHNIGFGYQALNLNQTGSYNYSIGYQSMLSNVDGDYNIGFGYQALRGNVSSDYNIGIGYQSLYSNTSGNRNIAVGYLSMYSNTGGYDNVAVGVQAMSTNTVGFENVAIGDSALAVNTTGIRNTAVGNHTLFRNTTGDKNVAVGQAALYNNVTGYSNVAIGRRALYTNSGGDTNIAVGDQSMISLVDGTDNVGIGNDSLMSSMSGKNNIAIGPYTLSNYFGDLNIAIGKQSLNDITYGGGNIGIGLSTMQRASSGSIDNIAIGPSTLMGQSGAVFSSNVAVGKNIMENMFTGSYNTAIGQGSAKSITSGSRNVSVGFQAMENNETQSDVVAVGIQSLNSLKTGSGNTAVGAYTLYTNLSADANTALGYYAGYNTRGPSNTAIGYRALTSIVNHNNNTAVGASALQYPTGNRNVAVGGSALMSASGGSIDQNVALGYLAMSALTSGSQNIAIGNSVATTQTGGSNNIAIGANVDLPNLGGSNQLNIGNEIYGSGMGTTTPNIGINTSAPTATLDINGNIRIRNGSSSGLVLISSTDGTASWGSVTVGSVSASGITGGVQNYITKFGTGGNGLVSSLLFDNGTQIGIGTAIPLAGTELDVTGDARFTGNVTVQGNLITDKIVNRTVTNVTISGSLLPDTTAPLTYRDIGTTALRWNNLYLSGQIAIAGGSPGVGKVLTSDANGLASWVTGFSGSYTSSGITGGTQYYVPKFGIGGNGLILSSIYDNGSIVGIGTSTATSRFEIWSGALSYFHMRGRNNIGFGSGSVRPALTGNENTGFGHESLFTLTTGYSNSAFGHQALRQSTAGFNNSAFGKEAMYNDGDGTWNTALGYQALRGATSSDYNVAIGGQALYTLGTGQGNVAIGHNALYAATTTTSNNTAIGYMAGSGITTGQNNILIGYGVQAVSNTASNQLNIGNWIYGSGGNIGIGTGGTAITAKLTLDSGTANLSGLRLSRLSNTSPTTSSGTVGLGVDANGNVVPVSNGDVIVYDGITSGMTAPDPNDSARRISYDFNKYFKIPAKQSFVISDGNGPGQNAPYIDDNAQYSVCEWTGPVGSGMTTCPTTDNPGTPYNSFTMSARGDGGYGYQIGLAYRGDVPLMARSGRFRDINSNGTIDASEYGSGIYVGSTTTPAPWYKVLTIPTNKMEWFYIDTGYTGRFSATGRDGRIGIGTTLPDYDVDIRKTVAIAGPTYFSGANSTAGAPVISFLGDTNMGLFRPAADTLAASTAGTERMRIFSNGNVSIGTTTNSAKLRVEGQVMITGGTPGAGKVLTSDASGLATWETPATGGGGSGASFDRYTYILGTAQNRTANSLADLGLTTVSLPVGTYNFKMIASYRTAATTTGIGFALVSNGAVIDRYVGQLSAQNNANSTDEVSSAVVGTALVSRNVPATGTDYAAIYQGTFRVTTAGGVKIQYQSEVNTSQVTVQPGANLIIEEV